MQKSATQSHMLICAQVSGVEEQTHLICEKHFLLLCLVVLVGGACVCGGEGYGSFHVFCAAYPRKYRFQALAMSGCDRFLTNNMSAMSIRGFLPVEAPFKIDFVCHRFSSSSFTEIYFCQYITSFDVNVSLFVIDTFEIMIIAM